IIISPYAKRGFVDHTQHDTLSILKTIETRFNLPSLNQYDADASSLSSSFQLQANPSIGGAYQQPDANNPGKFALIVGGTPSTDHIKISQDNGQVHVQISGSQIQYDHYFAGPISRIEVYAQGGNDMVVIDPSITVPSFVFGGDGNDHLEAQNASPAVVVGG